ncbi:hypothetical protein ASG60_20820 [Methylobacterium sp. Leaf469]|uniref:hypothetical protein n=1 Tax=Methylobacterium sp. Leaf469 TaxID=1736387 RepID=UPI0006F29CA5|nr:hypothetical protein [Methylobacterium sp. Leaf469]KQT96078.1 hypothetical protein ASG60_20820 [Methylobacterium sp. Leaf469]
MTDLFDAAGLSLPPIPAKKRKGAPRKPTPAERAATGRRDAARRPRSPQRHRIGPGRDLSHVAEVLPFPLSKNAKVLAAMTARLPDGHADNLEDVFTYERSKYARRLVARGLPKKTARLCANELFHQAYMIRATEAGIL